MIQLEAIDRALGRHGKAPEPLDIGRTVAERDAILEQTLWFPERPIPTGELANWAVAIIELGKEPAVLTAVAVVETALKMTVAARRDVDFVKKVLAELHVWIKSPKTNADLKRLGDLWWSLTRNRPDDAHTQLGDAAVMAWFVAGYDPEGWGNPPDAPDRVVEWMKDAADNTTAVVDVFSCVQQAVGAVNDSVIVQSIRKAVSIWRDASAAGCRGLD